MDRLVAQLQRLYFFPERQEALARGLGTGAAVDLAGPDGRVRAMAIGFDRPGDWEEVARLCEGIQEDLELPAPAISVSGKAGYQVWFSLAEAVTAEEAGAFLGGLARRYLADLPAAALRSYPDGDSGQGQVGLVPALHPSTGKWSAFIDPAMGSMFMDEPGLEMAPNLEKQADLLAGFESMKAADFRRVLAALQAPAEPAGASPEQASGAGHPSALGVGGNFTDPKSFLLAVMNDGSASPALRIEAAKALLPYFEGTISK